MREAERVLGARTAGVWTAADARAAGLSRDQVRGRLVRGEWQQLRRGTYADGGVEPDPAMRASSAVLRSQVGVADRQGRVVARLDLGDASLRLGVESDGSAYHRGRAAEDRRRDARTGWTIERCTWFETRCEPEQLLARVLRTAAGLRVAA